MDPEEERVRYLARIGREKIIKYGTYTVEKERPITQDHPFFVKREDPGPIQPAFMTGQVNDARQQPEAPAPEPDPVDDPAALASQIMSSNFKVGLSQEEVDALLNGM